MSAATALSASQRRSIGQRGWKVYWTLSFANAKPALQDLLGGALRLGCYEAAEAALREWETTNSRTRARIERRAIVNRSPEVTARRMTTEALSDMIAHFQSRPDSALLAAYRAEYKKRLIERARVRLLRDTDPEAFNQWRYGQLAPHEKRHLRLVRKRAVQQEMAGD